jgi:hypothetical protein
MDRLAYYGTSSGQRGHYFTAIRGEFPDAEKAHLIEVVDDCWLESHLYQHSDGKPTLVYIPVSGKYYAVYAVNRSKNDNRGGSITALIADYVPEKSREACIEEFKSEIANNAFLKNQFDI